MDRRTFLGALAGGLLAAPLAGEAQQAGKVYRVGCLSTYPVPPDGYDRGPLLNALEEGLRDIGFVPGRNLSIAYRPSGWDSQDEGWGDDERLRALAAELIGTLPDIMIAIWNPAISAVSRLAAPLPVVMVGATDPVGNGFALSLAQPGTNMTGLSLNGGFARQLEVLKEMIPGLSRVAVLWESRINLSVATLKGTEASAARHGVTLRWVALQSSADFEPAFRTLTPTQVDALVVWGSLQFYSRPFMNLVEVSGLPLIASWKEFVELGALASIGIDRPALFREAATYVGKILNGATPGVLPIERPRKWELAINRSVARTLGLTIPSIMLDWADEVIE